MSAVGNTESFLQAPLPERILAAIIDLAIVAGFCFFPKIGWIIRVFYFLLRDSLSFLKGQSFGKKLMKMKVITIPEQESLVGNPEKSIIRGIIFLIPFLNLIDIWYLVTTGIRLADRWAQTAVIPYLEENDEV